MDPLVAYLLVGLLALVSGLLFAILRRLRRLDEIHRGMVEETGRIEALASAAETLPGALRAIEDRLESLRPPPAPEPPPPAPEPAPVRVQVEVADDLHAAVRSAIADLERDLKKMLRVAGRTRAERLAGLVERKLLNLGYTNIEITGGLPRTRSPGARSRVRVDADRDGQRHRGFVTLRGNEVEDARLSPLHLMFP